MYIYVHTYIIHWANPLCCLRRLVMATTAITMLGPGLALRGPDGSMNLAVDGILFEFELLYRLLNLTIQVRVRIDDSYVTKVHQQYACVYV